MIDRRILREIDGLSLGLVFSLSLIGLLFIYSSSYYFSSSYYSKQFLWLLISAGALVIVLMIDYQHLLTFSFPIYVVAIVTLLLTLAFSRYIAGMKGWLVVSFFRFQPAELTKVAIILVLAQFFSRHRQDRLSQQIILGSCGLVALPLILVLFQPDLGTAVCFLPLLLASLFLAGLSRKATLWVLILTLLVGIGSWHFYLKDYQKKRLITVFFPGQDRLGSGYQLLQSKIAIGSGGFLGKGFKKGTQSRLRFLPARHTDFIFSVISEEFGLVGSLTVISLFLGLIWRLLRMVETARDRGGKYIIYMVACLLAFETIINIAMVIGFFPVVGIPLPFVSYGGSSLLTHFLAVGLAVNVRMRRFANV